MSTEAVFGVRQQLRRDLQQDGVKCAEGFAIARYAQVDSCSARPRANTHARTYMHALNAAPQVFGEGNNIYELWIAVESFEMRAAPMISAAAPGVLPKVDIDVISDNDT